MKRDHEIIYRCESRDTPERESIVVSIMQCILKLETKTHLRTMRDQRFISESYILVTGNSFRAPLFAVYGGTRLVGLSSTPKYGVLVAAGVFSGSGAAAVPVKDWLGRWNAD